VANQLITSSFKNRLFYLAILALFGAIVVYFIYIKDPGIKQNLERQAFQLNYSALQNAIRLQKYQYIVYKSNLEISKELTRRLNGLEFNRKGFPIAAEIIDKAQQSPRNALDCQQIWQKVLGPLQPVLQLSPQENSYWVDITVDDICVFRSVNIHDLEIHYDAVKGLVSLVAINR